VTTRRLVEFSSDDAEAVTALEALRGGRGWCNLTPEVAADDVDVLGVNVLSLRVKRGAPVATYVTSPAKRGEERPSTLGVLHTRGRLGATRIDSMLEGASYALRQDHNQRGLLLEVPPTAEPAEVLACMQRMLSSLCDYDRTGTWRLDVFERST
jgi:hypothetical protein